MIVALLIGREKSIGFPGKNTCMLFGRPMMAYPIIAAKKSKYVERVYVSTDSEKIKQVGKEYGAEIIDRPPELCTNTALGENVFVHGYHEIKDRLKKEGKEVEMILLLHCNSPTITPELINEGVEALRKNAAYDSAVSVSKYNMWSPLRARKIGADGLLHPFVPFETFGDPKKLNCDRDSQGDVWFADMSVSIVRPRCLENIHDGLLPQKWMGQKIYPLKQWGALDVDYEWQMPQAEYWLRKNRHCFEDSGKPLPKKNLDYIKRVENSPETREGYLRLDKNENIIGFDEKFIGKAREKITSEFLTMYPEVYRIYDKIGKWLGIGHEMLYVSAGSDGAIKAAFEVFVDEGDEVIIPDPTYALYYVYADMFGAVLKRIKFNDNLELHADAIINAISDKTRLICIANPNSPTGTVLSQKDLASIIKHAKEKNAVVLIDEAYYPYYNETMVGMAAEFENVIVTRSFTKAYGLGSARLGFAVANKYIIGLLKKFRPMYEVNSYAVMLGCMVLDDPEMIKQNLEKFREGKGYLEKSLDRLGIGYFKSNANFILMKAKDKETAKRIEQELKKRKILVRTGFSEPLDKCVRAGIGAKPEMEVLVKNLEEVMGELK